MNRDAALPARRSTFGGVALPASFYDRATELVARELLGAVLEHRTPAGVARGRIVEVEAYLGPHDPACHSARGLTPRTTHLHGPPGAAYVYLIYGVHYCVNAVTREAGFGSAVLIRALEPLAGLDLMRARRGQVRDADLASGPGKLCQALGIDRRMDGASLRKGALRILAGAPLTNEEVATTPRIGITQASDWPLRFFEARSPWISQRRARAHPSRER